MSIMSIAGSERRTAILTALENPFKRSFGSVSIPDSLAISATRTMLAPQLSNFSINAVLSINDFIELFPHG
ncbi:hypothetical protein DSCO28_45340 [Desulfosarcina ovata subsp. sediminis]|uniref:Uncharacterized protein n=2 Tax=Desulfosarcina ovata TaxID=83564 RepID=A0A5K8AD41_9BACT|nr:hypothetical protein DSCO28_45340 [Desulfosarcina ovata subsp. sediminis]BBO90446.1 hypothetical protein DSCOOX_36260 [Desulfosarcina ovata subsp. ovata]